MPSGLIPASSASFDRRSIRAIWLIHIPVGLQELDRPLFLLIPLLGDRVEAVLQRVVLPLVRTQGVEDVKVFREFQLLAQLLCLALDLVRELAAFRSPRTTACGFSTRQAARGSLVQRTLLGSAKHAAALHPAIFVHRS